MMKKCIYCGHLNEDSEKNCTLCGNDLSDSVYISSDDPIVSSSNEFDSGLNHNTKKIAIPEIKIPKKVLMGAGAAAAVFILFGVIVANAGKANDNDVGPVHPELQTTAATAEAVTQAEIETEPAAEYENAVEADNSKTPLKILVWSRDVDDINKMVEIFCENTSYDKNSIEVEEFHQIYKDVYPDYKKYLEDESNDADIIILNTQWMKRFINDDSSALGTLSLEEIGFKDSDYSDLYDVSVKGGKDDAGNQKALMVSVPVSVFCYKESLAERYLDVKSPDDMQNLIIDWDKFMETAVNLDIASHGECDIVGAVNEMWWTMTSTRKSPWIIDNKFTVEDDTKKFLDICRYTYVNGYVRSDSRSLDDAWATHVRDNEVLGDFIAPWVWQTYLPEVVYGEGNKYYGNMKISRGPADAYMPGAWFSVANRCDNKALAKEFISFFTTDTEKAKIFAQELDAFTCNKTAIEEINSEDIYVGPAILNHQNPFVIMNDIAENITMDALCNEDLEVYKSFETTVYEYGNKPEKYTSTDEIIIRTINDTVNSLPEVDYSNFF
ncbi:MAG: hypothetical protein ACI4KF_07580 [Huintestinicola sp.]